MKSPSCRPPSVSVDSSVSVASSTVSPSSAGASGSLSSSSVIPCTFPCPHLRNTFCPGDSRHDESVTQALSPFSSRSDRFIPHPHVPSSMYEVEVKVPADLDRVRDRLDSLGAEDGEQLTQIDVYYDAPHRSFARTDEAVRVRRERTESDERVELTYKGPLIDDETKTREEVQTSVASGSAVETILERLGFSATATVEKDRTVYDLDGYTVTLDDVKRVGQYVEVEKPVESDDVAAARTGAYDV